MIFRNPNNEKCYKSDLIGKQVLFIWDEFWTFSCSLRGVKYEGIFLRKTMTQDFKIINYPIETNISLSAIFMLTSFIIVNHGELKKLET